MAMLSELLRFTVADEHGRTAKLDDLSYPAVGEDYPHIARVYFANGEIRSVPWNSVVDIDHRRCVVKIKDLAASAANDVEKTVEVLLRRDVLDGLVIDLLKRTTTRATDVLLMEESGRLGVKAVDSGFNAMLRRISRGWYKRVGSDTLIDWKYVEFLKGDPASVQSGTGYRMRIGRLPAGEIAQLSEYVPYLHAAELLTLLPDDKAADVLEAMSVERQVQVIEEFDEMQANQLIRRMSPDLAADLLARVDVSLMRRHLHEMPKKQSERILELLRYPEHSVGGVMINDMICQPANKTAGEFREDLPKLIKERDFVDSIFIVSDPDEKKLVGVIALRELLSVDDDRTLGDVMDPFLQSLDPFDDAKEAAYRIVSAQLSAMPVVNPQGTLVGAMTIDAAIGQLVSGEMQTLRIFS